MNAQEIMNRADALGCPVFDDEAQRLADYLNALVKYNRKMNLVGPHDEDEIFDTLFVDSLYLSAFLEELDIEGDPVCYDLGAGAGIPGIPLRCIWQRGAYHLVEVREKRTIFMQTALAQLRLPETSVFQGRAEDTPEKLPAADIILSRAFMPWEKLCDFVRPLFGGSGILIVLSNDPVPEELPEGYSLIEENAYPAAGKERFFWALELSE